MKKMNIDMYEFRLDRRSSGLVVVDVLDDVSLDSSSDCKDLLWR